MQMVKPIDYIGMFKGSNSECTPLVAELLALQEALELVLDLGSSY